MKTPAISACIKAAAISCLLSLAASSTSCTKPEPPQRTVTGMRPIYISEQEFYDIRNVAAQPLRYTGTIYIWQEYFLVIEYKQGIHVYNRSNADAPEYVTFLRIPGCADFTIADHTLFADNGFDILSIDIADIRNIRVNTVIKNATKNSIDIPPGYTGYFECRDPSKGYYLGWESATLTNPLCQINK